MRGAEVRCQTTLSLSLSLSYRGERDRLATSDLRNRNGGDTTGKLLFTPSQTDEVELWTPGRKGCEILCECLMS